MDNKYCYMTLMTNKNYLACIIRQAQRMKYLKCKYPFIVMIPKNDDYLKNQLIENNILYEEIEIYKFLSKDRFADMINKFQLFNYTQFEKICFLDGDIILNRNMDFIFEKYQFEEFLCFEIKKSFYPAGNIFLVKTNSNGFKKFYSLYQKYLNLFETKVLYDDEGFIQFLYKKNELNIQWVNYEEIGLLHLFIHFFGAIKLFQLNKIFFPFFYWLFYQASDKEFNNLFDKCGKDLEDYQLKYLEKGDIYNEC